MPTKSIALPSLYRLEAESAYLLYRLVTAAPTKQQQSTFDIQLVPNSLDEIQRTAASSFTTHPISVVTGGPGTGKTTTLRTMIESGLQAGLRIHAMCPSANAGRRIEELMDKFRDVTSVYPPSARLTIGTVHKALQWNGVRYRRDLDNPFDSDLIILDEGSMSSIGMIHGILLCTQPNRTRIVICGDDQQLPSIEPGCILRDIIASGAVPVYRLEKVYRTGAESGIAKNAARMRKGQMPSSRDEDGVIYTDFRTFHAESDEDILKNALEVADRFPVETFQALSLGYRGMAGVDEMNNAIRRLKNNNSQRKGLGEFCLGDRVINKKNCKEHNCYNGQTAVIMEIGTKGMILRFHSKAGVAGDGIVKVEKGFEGLKLKLAYCITIHGAQGSEFMNGFLAVSPAHWTLLSKNSVYTGLTRFQKSETLAYQPRALGHAIKQDQTGLRQTGLVRMIRNYFQKAA